MAILTSVFFICNNSESLRKKNEFSHWFSNDKFNPATKITVSMNLLPLGFNQLLKYFHSFAGEKGFVDFVHF